MVTEADLEKVISSPGTKAARARALIELGCDRTDVVELLGVSYSQAHSAWKEVNGGTTAVSKGVVRASKGSQRSAAGAARPAHPSRLNLRPAQTRVATQDGHEVLRDLDGRHCTSCDHEITFSLRHLAFVHTNSKKEPTELEDNYA